MTKRAAIYCRVSTAMQERDGVSLDSQLDMARRYCTERGWTLIETYTDVMSGRSAKRPDLVRLQAAAKEKRFDVVIVYKLDRLSRSAYHYYQLLAEFGQSNIDIASLTQPFDSSTASGRFMLGALILLAQMESDTISERVADNVRYLATQGRQLPSTRAPLGYRYHKTHVNEAGEKVPGRVEIEPSEVPIVEAMFGAYLETRSTIATAKRLNMLGYTTREGRAFDGANMAKLLRNPIYCGDLAGCRYETKRIGDAKRLREKPSDQWIVTKNVMPAIVSREDWDEAQRLMAEGRKKGPKLTNSARKHPWSGLLKCGNCGGPLVRYADHKGFRYYRCRTAFYGAKVRCTAPGGVSELFLEAVVLPQVFEAIERWRRPVKGKPVERQRSVSAPVDRQASLETIAESKRRITRVYSMPGSVMTDAEYDQIMAELDTKAERIAAAPVEPEHLPLAPRIPENLSEIYESLNPSVRGDLLRVLIVYGEVKDRTLRLNFHEYADPGWPSVLEVPITRTRRQPN